MARKMYRMALPESLYIFFLIKKAITRPAVRRQEATFSAQAAAVTKEKGFRIKYCTTHL